MKYNIRMVLTAALSCSIGCLSLRQLRADTFGSGGNQFTIDFVHVVNPGNLNDAGAGGGSYSSPYGGVAYSYRISKYEISQDVITKATAQGLANIGVGTWTGNQPSAGIRWYEAAAFVNWLNTSQGYHAAYDLVYSGGWAMGVWDNASRATTGVDSGTNPFRHQGAYYFLPSEDEWYKAAYHKNDGSTANYWDYPTASNVLPDGIDFSGDPNYQAVFPDPFAPSAPSVITAAGSSASAYGTFGQGGNVWEFIESANDGSNEFGFENRTARGGALADAATYLRSSERLSLAPGFENFDLGFRVASIPEPSAALLTSLLAGGAWLMQKRKR